MAQGITIISMAGSDALELQGVAAWAIPARVISSPWSMASRLVVDDTADRLAQILADAHERG